MDAKVESRKKYKLRALHPDERAPEGFLAVSKKPFKNSKNPPALSKKKTAQKENTPVENVHTKGPNIKKTPRKRKQAGGKRLSPLQITAKIRRILAVNDHVSVCDISDTPSNNISLLHATQHVQFASDVEMRSLLNDFDNTLHLQPDRYFTFLRTTLFS